MSTSLNLSIKVYHASKTYASPLRVGTPLSMLRLMGTVCSSSVTIRDCPAMITLSIRSGTIRELAARKSSRRPFPMQSCREVDALESKGLSNQEISDVAQRVPDRQSEVSIPDVQCALQCLMIRVLHQTRKPQCLSPSSSSSPHTPQSDVLENVHHCAPG